MLTPVVQEISARKQRRAAKARRASRPAVSYVPYRRRSATSTVSVATVVVQRDGASSC